MNDELYSGFFCMYTENSTFIDLCDTDNDEVGCEHLCVLDPVGIKQCACAVGFRLAPDQRSCISGLLSALLFYSSLSSSLCTSFPSIITSVRIFETSSRIKVSIHRRIEINLKEIGSFSSVHLNWAMSADLNLSRTLSCCVKVQRLHVV